MQRFIFHLRHSEFLVSGKQFHIMFLDTKILKNVNEIFW